MIAMVGKVALDRCDAAGGRRCLRAGALRAVGDSGVAMDDRPGGAACATRCHRAPVAERRQHGVTAPAVRLTAR